MRAALFRKLGLTGSLQVYSHPNSNSKSRCFAMYVDGRAIRSRHCFIPRLMRENSSLSCSISHFHASCFPSVHQETAPPPRSLQMGTLVAWVSPPRVPSPDPNGSGLAWQMEVVSFGNRVVVFGSWCCDNAACRERRSIRSPRACDRLPRAKSPQCRGGRDGGPERTTKKTPGDDSAKITADTTVMRYGDNQLSDMILKNTADASQSRSSLCIQVMIEHTVENSKYAP